MKKEYIIYGLLIVIILILVVLCVLFAFGKLSFNNTNNNDGKNKGNTTTKTTTTETTPTTTALNDGLGLNDTFNYKTTSGVVEVIGYPYTKKIEDFESDEKQTYVYFIILETKSDDFKKYIKNQNGNMFVGKNAIGIGCLIKGQISYFNFSDESLKKVEAYTYDFSKADTDRIMNVT